MYDDVVITGGGGAIGLHYARHLAERGARRIVLLSRGGADTTALTRLAETHGTEILAPPCDITDPVALAAAAAEFGGDGASLVIHAAGVATIAAAPRPDPESVSQTFSAKVAGLALLEATWPVRPEARILLCSSVSGLWGGRGHAAYSAANRMLDVIACQMRDRGRRCTSVRWGLWQGTGVIDADEITRVERSGLRAMRPERAIGESLRDRAADPLVFSADADRLRIFLGEQPGDRAGLPRSRRSGGHGRCGHQRSRHRRRVPCRTGLCAEARRHHRAGPGISLLDLGVDSLLALDLRKKLKHATGRTCRWPAILGGVTAHRADRETRTTREESTFA